jgi:hypothetical protein
MGVRGGNAARNFCTVGSASILSRQRLKARKIIRQTSEPF